MSVANLTETQLANGVELMALTLHDLAPMPRTEKYKDDKEYKEASIQQWKEHIEKYKNDPVGFFGANKQGLQEYENFVNSHDEERHTNMLRRKGVI